MATETRGSAPEKLTTKLFAIVVAGTVAFLIATVALMSWTP